ncbi:hypothetical protein ACWC10_33235 [Streptomyces sp. NPDC001595]|uniref:hypothetical protein n=1 Tax=Streptomyces sp. NPDC001532 TaxID=3154520 RepID=UPI0033175FCB
MHPYSDTIAPAMDAWPVCDPYGSTTPDEGTGGDYLLPPPNPATRLDIPLSPADRRRLDLHAALTIRGIAPLPGDQHAVDAISSLGETVTTAVLRWVTSPAE